MPLAKARIELLENSSKRINVLFNPPSLKITSSNTYADVKTPGGAPEKSQFIKNNCDILSVDLFFDTSYIAKEDKKTKEVLQIDINKDKIEHDVKKLVAPIIKLTEVEKGKKEPPKLKFIWGEIIFTCFIISIDHTYEFFDAAGTPQRATLSIKFRRADQLNTAAPAPAKAPKADTAKKEVVKAGQDLTCFCPVPEDWRKVAEINDINNPHVVNSGEMVGQAITTVQ